MKKKTDTHLFTEKFSWTTTIHPGIFHGRALWADSVSLQTNCIASHVQFKPIRIGENLVVNYYTHLSVQWLEDDCKMAKSFTFSKGLQEIFDMFG